MFSVSKSQYHYNFLEDSPTNIKTSRVSRTKLSSSTWNELAFMIYSQKPLLYQWFKKLTEQTT